MVGGELIEFSESHEMVQYHNHTEPSPSKGAIAMRLRLFFAITSLLLLGITGSAFAAEQANAEQKMPRVAHNQHRPVVVQYDIQPQQPDIPGDDSGGGGSSGTCNCNRNCDSANPGCSLTNDPCSGCRAILGGSCESCIGKNNCGC